MTRIIFLDGPDNTGKTTFIKELVSKGVAKEIRYNKTLPDGTPLTIHTEKDFAFMRMLIDALDPNVVWIMDRCYIVNYVMSRYVDGRDTYPTENFRFWLSANHFHLEAIALGDKRTDAYEDDHASYTAEEYNNMVELYACLSTVNGKLFSTDGEFDTSFVDDIMSFCQS